MLQSGDEDRAEESRIKPSVISDIRDIPWFADALAKSKGLLSKLPKESLPSWIRERPDLLLDDDAVPEDQIDYDYADADRNGHVMTNPNESMAYMGPTTRMRRRKAGEWEPVPENGDS